MLATQGRGPGADGATFAILSLSLSKSLTAMYEVVLALPEETANALALSLEAMGAEVRLAAAVKLFELERLSSGAAASLAGIPRTLFLAKLGDYGVNTFALDEAALIDDLANA
jgi:predicted HTH domain antitoxin